MQIQKSLGFIFLILCSCHLSQAQVRIFAGPQLTTAKYTILNDKQETEYKQGFMAGIGLTTWVEGPLYFAPSLFYSRKGYKVVYDMPSDPPAAGALNNDVTYNSIVLAPLLQFNLSKKKSHLFIRFGPSIEVALSGQEIFDSTGGKTIDRAMRFGPTSYSPATASADIQWGYQTAGGLTIYVHYQHGLSSLNNADRGPMILQRVAGLSLGWRFGRK